MVNYLRSYYERVTRFISAGHTLISSLPSTLSKWIRIFSVIRELNLTIDELGSLSLEIKGNVISMDADGNVSLYSPSSLSIKSKLIFLVANENPLNQEDTSFINGSISADKEGALDVFIDKEEILAL